MKLLLLSFSFLFLSQFSSYAQSIQGYWITENSAAKVEIYKTASGTLEGKIIWTKDPSEKIRKTVGSVILKNLKKSSEKEFEGLAIDPRTNKEYNCIITVNSENQIDMRGYIGLSIFGKTEHWNRAIK